MVRRRHGRPEADARDQRLRPRARPRDRARAARGHRPHVPHLVGRGDLHRFTAFREWDVSELSLAKYTSLVGSGDRSLQAIPVFPSRVFRHAAFYVRDDGSVREPGDLAGRRVGVPEWIQTAGVYARGVLVHQYGVPPADVGWVQGGVNESGREELVAPTLPPGVAIEAVSDRTL